MSYMGTFLYHSHSIQEELIKQLCYQVMGVKISSTQRMDLAV